MTDKNYTDGTPTVSLVYQSGGRLSSATAAGVATTTFNYDGLGRINAYSQGTLGNWYTFQNFSYNLADGLKSVQTPAGRTVAWGYDGAGRIKEVTGLQQGAAATYAEAMTYSPLGGLASWRMGARESMTLSGSTITKEFVNLQTQTIWAAPPPAWTQSFLYDGLGRVKRITESGLQQNYAYDRHGNRAVAADTTNWYPSGSRYC